MKALGIIFTAACTLLAGTGCAMVTMGNSAVSGRGGARSFAALSCSSSGLTIRAWGVDYPRGITLRLLLVISLSGDPWKVPRQDTTVTVEDDGTWHYSKGISATRSGSYGLDLEIYDALDDARFGGVNSGCRR